MRVGILSHGTRGDVQPFIALGLELKAGGHEVAICGPCSTSDLVRSYGLEAHSLTFDAKKMITSEKMQSAMRKGDGNQCVTAFIEESKKQKAEGADSTEEASTFVAAFKPDILVGHPSLPAFIVIAEKHGLPVVNAMFMPFLPSRTAYPLFKTLASIAAAGNLDRQVDLHRELYEAFLGKAELAELNQVRERWGLHPYSNLAEMHSTFQSVPFANCWSAAVVPEPADMVTEFPLARQTGYIFLDDPDYKAPPELRLFLNSSVQDKPLYVGFGSLSAGDPREVTEKVIRALIIAGRKRCVMAGGWSGIGPEHLDPILTKDYTELKQFADAMVLKVESVSHSWLLPLCSAAIHHGGAGTTGAVARAGIPTGIVPFAWDQPGWAERMEMLGVGISLSGMITKVSVEELGLAIKRLTSDSMMAERAATLGAHIRSESSGAGQLAKFIEGSLTARLFWPTAAQPLASPLPAPLWDRGADRIRETPKRASVACEKDGANSDCIAESIPSFSRVVSLDTAQAGA